MQTFDVVFSDKALKWQGLGDAAARVEPAAAWGRSSPLRDAGPRALTTPFTSECRARESAERGARFECRGAHCQGCTALALAALVCLHLAMLRSLTSLVVSVYILVLGPLLSTFYHVSAAAQVHLYVLTLCAVTVLLLNVRYRRDFSALFFAAGALVLLHILCGARPREEPAEPATELRTRLLVGVLVGVNALAAYLCALGSLANPDGDAYNPQLHGAQALLLALDVLVYAGAQAR